VKAVNNRVIILDLGLSLGLLVVLRFTTRLDYLSTVLVILATVVALNLDKLPRAYVEKTRRSMITSLLTTGRGLKASEIKLLGLALKITEILVLLLSLFTVLYSTMLGLNSILLIATCLAIALLVVILVLPKILVYSWTSARKTSIEVELPYLAILLRVVSAMNIPIYDVLSLIENSTALQASAREVKFARKIAMATRVSLLGALDNVFSHHPSEKVVNYLRRLIIAASTYGDLASVSEKIFDTFYNLFESKISGLVGNFTIIVGTSLFVYLFLPVIIAAVAPVMGGSLLLVLGASLSIQLFVFFALYAMIMSLYPTSLVVKPSSRLRVVSIATIVLTSSILLYNLFSTLTNNMSLSENTVFTLIPLITAPALVLSELEYRRVALYDSFVRVASEALSLAAATGENPASSLERSASKYGRGIVRFTRTITTGYVSEKLRKAIVARSPSLFHAAFIETLVNILRLGATPEMLRLFTSSFERLNTLVSRVRGFAKSLEAVITGLVAVVGGFLTYINRVFETILSLIQSAKTSVSIPLSIPFTYDPRIYSLLFNLSILSLLFISLFIGYIRGGSYTYGFRTFIVMLIVYMVSKSIMAIIIP
jgi:archaellum biogenesis protein FlaJ (TadC family)